MARKPKTIPVWFPPVPPKPPLVSYPRADGYLRMPKAIRNNFNPVIQPTKPPKPSGRMPTPPVSPYAKPAPKSKAKPKTKSKPKAAPKSKAPSTRAPRGGGSGPGSGGRGQGGRGGGGRLMGGK